MSKLPVSAREILFCATMLTHALDLWHSGRHTQQKAHYSDKKVGMLEKIISGGQTGADQGALDGAISCGFPYGGSLPASRKTENGVLPLSYDMAEIASDRYADRTEKNVMDGDATLIVSHGLLTGGSALTMKIAKRLGKPCIHLDFNTYNTDKAVAEVSAWIETCRVGILNVAGPRASSDTEIYDCTRTLVVDLISLMKR